MAALDNPLFVLTKHPLHVFSKLIFEEKITLTEFESICNRLLLSPVHILTRILEPPHQVKGDCERVGQPGLCDRWKAFLVSALSDQGERTPVSSPVHVSYDLLQGLVSLLQPIDGGLGVQEFHLASRKMIQASPKYHSLIVLLGSLKSS